MTEQGWKSSDGIPLGPSAALAGIEWNLRRLREIGVHLPPDNRLERARRLLENVNDYKISLTTADRELLAKVAEAQWAAFQQHIICRTTANPHGISNSHREKLEQMLGGADLPEWDTNSIARDTQFELYAGAMLSMGGVPVMLAEPDLQVFIAGREFGLAAKRVKTPKQLRKRVSEAVKQIRRTRHRGFVVVCVDLLVNDTGLPGGAMERGAAFDERIARLHELDEWLVEQEAVVGRMAIGHDSIWHLGGERPGLEVAMVRQHRLFPRSSHEEEALKGAFDDAEVLIAERLRNL